MCGACHGLDLISSGAPAPDLRESYAALNPNSFYTIVHDGALIQEGMPRFDMLSHDQVMALYAYIRAGARQALEGPTAASANPVAASPTMTGPAAAPH
jgi:quinohemoprotein ethanol dehydrogenase